MMSYSIKFYNTPDKANIINKTLNGELTVTGLLKDNSSIYNPSFRIKLNKDLFNKNYFYVDMYKRYYFITDIVIEDNVEMVISGKVDVLESFKDDILNSRQIIGRQESQYNVYLVDDMIQSEGRDRIAVEKIGSSPFVTDADLVSGDDFNITLLVNNAESYTTTPAEEIGEGEGES